jgi:hypothetical protein
MEIQELLYGAKRDGCENPLPIVRQKLGDDLVFVFDRF